MSSSNPSFRPTGFAVAPSSATEQALLLLLLPLPKDAARLGKGFGKGRLGRDATRLGAIALAGSAGLSGAGAQEPLAEMLERKRKETCLDSFLFSLIVPFYTHRVGEVDT